MQKQAVAIRLESQTVQKIKAKADKDQRTVSDYLRIFIEKHF